MEETDLELFETYVGLCFDNLIIRDDFPSISWVQNLLENFISCGKKFETLIYENGMHLSREVMNHLISPYLHVCLNSLELINGIREGVDYLLECHIRLNMVRMILQGQNVGRSELYSARAFLNDLEALIENEKESNYALAARIIEDNEEIDMHLEPPRLFRTRVSRLWSASKQLDLLKANLSLPTAVDNRETNQLADSVYTMACAHYMTMWCLVAALPCQGRPIDIRFYVNCMEGFKWYEDFTYIWSRIHDESIMEENRHCSGLLREASVMEQLSW
ncbi:protein BYPASS1-LIKE-like [Cornus florida]|uniref:protein BYPASS1-LIKE-like n=1 Tax=Cornus florida TaxID=4283 RepID=UPI0028A073E1|nr:protein BYPASS1-LIKE-like [Cornus florida]